MTIIQIILSAISPELRDLILKFAKELEAKAKKTPNPFDDVAVEVLKVILGINKGTGSKK